ncbi:MAG: aminoglycoside phosphotransferase family protein [Actinomycetota bacterium]|nr:aminoglycoside phosphotransferase family protein [Actinomycetota bacterium]
MEITAGLVVELVAAQFPGWAGLPVRPVERDGWDNRTFRLGDELSVRLPRTKHYAAQAAKEHRWLPVLAPRLPLAIPQSLALGSPTDPFPWPWSVRRWLPGDPLTADRVRDLSELANDLAEFLVALQSVDTVGGPAPGAHNFGRGGPIGVYDEQTRKAIASLSTEIDGHRASTVWEKATGTTWDRPGVWVHGDISPSNLLVADGRLGAVIDFGGCAVGDPACDLTVAWTAFSDGARTTFLSRLGLDHATVARARGWALWKALITLAQGPSAAETARIQFGWHWPVLELLEQIFNDSP